MQMECFDGRSGRAGGRGERLIWRAILACGLCLAALLAPLSPARAAGLPAAVDLAADARLAARDKVPVLLLYTRADCSWCEKLRREYLLPITREATPRAVIREIRMDERLALVDFAGRRTTSAYFAESQKARFAPTLMFYDPKGQPSADPIVGFRTADFYAAYLDRALEESHQHIARQATTQ